jgi:hypothetical protein
MFNIPSHKGNANQNIIDIFTSPQSEWQSLRQTDNRQTYIYLYTHTHTHKMEYDSAIKNEIMPFLGQRMELTIMMLS